MTIRLIPLNIFILIFHGQSSHDVVQTSFVVNYPSNNFCTLPRDYCSISFPVTKMKEKYGKKIVVHTIPKFFFKRGHIAMAIDWMEGEVK